MSRCTCPLAFVSRRVIGKGGGSRDPRPRAWVPRRLCVFKRSSRAPAPRTDLFRAGLITLGSVLGGDAGGASAQGFDPCPVLAEPLFQSLPARITCPLATGHQEAEEAPTLTPGRAFLYSALVPGLGQHRLGKRRWLAYVAVEAASWIAFGHARGSAVDRRDEYQDLAWDVGRSFTGSRVDGDFPYYEAMQKFELSGAFDTDVATPGVQPEMDPSTFNGRAWSLATEIHFPAGANPLPGDPEYDAALTDYQARAYDEPFLWSWAGQSAAWAEYKDLIDSSDGYFRRASQFLGVVVANHLLSGIDAFVTARIPGSSGGQAEARIRLMPRGHRGGLDLLLQVTH